MDMAAASVLERQKLNRQHCIEMADETGEIVFTVKFGEVVKVES